MNTNLHLYVSDEIFDAIPVKASEQGAKTIGNKTIFWKASSLDLEPHVVTNIHDIPEADWSAIKAPARLGGLSRVQWKEIKDNLGNELVLFLKPE